MLACVSFMLGVFSPMQPAVHASGQYRGPEFSTKLLEFDAKYGVTSRQLDDSGFIHSATGTFSGPIVGLNPLEVAIQFFQDNREVFGMRDPRGEFIPWEKECLAGALPLARCGFNQVLDGITTGGELSLYFAGDGRLERIQASYSRGIDPNMDTHPTLSLEQALDAIALSITLPTRPEACESGLVITSGLLAWRIRIGGRWAGKYWVDAQRGEILRQEPSVRQYIRDPSIDLRPAEHKIGGNTSAQTELPSSEKQDERSNPDSMRNITLKEGKVVRGRLILTDSLGIERTPTQKEDEVNGTLVLVRLPDGAVPAESSMTHIANAPPVEPLIIDECGNILNRRNVPRNR